MKISKSLFAVLGLALVAILAPNAFAQDALPKPDPGFKGKIGSTYNDSTPNFPMPVTAAKGSPNVLVILLDDVGFGMCSTYGGPVPTPHMDKLANNGLKYNRFHTTALCGPTCYSSTWRVNSDTISNRTSVRGKLDAHQFVD